MSVNGSVSAGGIGSEKTHSVSQSAGMRQQRALSLAFINTWKA